MRCNRFRAVLATAAVSVVVLSTSPRAATLTWDANGTTAGQTDGAGAWLNANQWWDGAANVSWTSGDDAIIGLGGAGGAVTLTGSTVVNSLTLNSFTGTYTLGTAGQTITLNTGIIKNTAATAAIASIITPVTLGGAQAWTNNTVNTDFKAATGSLSATGGLNLNGNLLTIDGVGTTNFGGTANFITGAGGITKNGTGVLILGAGGTTPVHNYSGTTTINGGIVRIYGNLSANSALTINEGVLEDYWTGTFSRALGTGVGQFQITGGVSGFSGQGSSSATVRINNDANYEVVWGSDYFKPTTLVLQASTVNTDGKVTWQNKVDLNGATRTIAVNQTGGNMSGYATMTGVIRTSSSTAGLTKTGPGQLILSGANTFNGPVTVNQGTLSINSINNVASANPLGQSSAAAANLLLANGTTLQYTGGAASTDRGFTINGTAAGDSATLNAAGTGAVSFTSTASPAYGVADQTRTLILTGTNTSNNTLAAGISDNGTGAVSVTKTGVGLWLLSGASSYTGATTVTAGTLTAAKAASLPGYGTSGKVTVAAGATLAVQTGDGTAGWDAGQIDSLRGAATWSARSSVLAFDTTSGNFAYGSNIGQALTVAKLGANTLSLSGANTYTGGTTINAGTLSFTGTALAGSGLVTFAGSSTLQWGTGTTTDLSSRLVINNGVTATINTNSNDVAFGTSFGGGSSGALTKAGAGNLTLSKPNTYTGLTTVSAGTLTLTNNLAIQNSPLVTTGAGTIDITGLTTPTFGGLSGASGDLATVLGTPYGSITALTLNPASGTSVTYGGVIANGSGNMPLIKTGAGTQTLNGSAVNTYTGATTVNRGTMIIDFANMTTPTDLIGSGSALVMGSGALQVKQKNATVTSQTFSGTTINAGGSTIQATNTGGSATNTLTVALGALTRNAGGVVNFTLPTSGQGAITTSTANDPTGILGRWATTGLTTSLQYAANNGSGNIIGYTSATPATAGTLANVTSATTNYSFGAAATIPNGSALTGNTFRYAGAAAALDIGSVAANTNTLTLNGLMNAGSGALTVQRTGAGATGGLVIGSSNELVIVTNNQGMTISAPIMNNGAAPGAVTFASYGGGVLTLSGTSTYSGGTVVSAGAVTLGTQANSALGTGPLTLNPGTQLNIDRNTLSMAVAINDATIAGGNSFGTVFSGPINVTGVATLLAATGTGNIDYTGNISGPGSVRSLGSREDSQLAVDLFGTNTFAGPAMIGANANMRFNNRVSLPNTGSWTADNLVVEAGGAAYFMVGGAGQFTAADIDILAALGTASGGFKNGSFLGLENAAAFAYTSVIADTNGGANMLGFKKFGGGTLTLGNNNTYTGPTYLHAGTLEVSSLNSVVGGTASSSLGAPKTVADGTIVLNPYSPTVTLKYIGTGETTDRMFNTKGSHLVLDQSGTGLLKFSSDISGTGNISFQGSTAGTGEFAGAIGGATKTLTKNGTGTWTLSGANTYGGVTTVNGGTLQLAKQVSLYNNNPASWTNANIIVNSGGTLALNVGGSGEFTAGNVTALLTNLGGLGGAVNNNGLRSGSKFAFDTTNAAGGTFTVADNVANSTGTGGGAIGLTKLGTNTLVLTGANTYTGVTTIAGGALQFAKEVSLYNNTPASWTKTNIIVNSGGTLGLNVGGTGEFTTADVTTLLANLTVGINNNGLRSGSTIAFDTTNAAGGTFTIADNLANSTGTGGGAIGLTKLGTNTLVLTGTNTYTGATAVNAGTLRVDGSIAASSMTTVNSGGTLSGKGTVGPLTLQGGTVSPGSSVGTLAAADTVLTDTSSYVFQIDDANGTAGAAGGPGWDLLDIAGTVDLSGLSTDGFTVDINTLLPGGGTSPGAMASFLDSGNYSWEFIRSSGGLVGAFDAGDFLLDTSGITNAFTGAFGVSNVGNSLFVTYTGAAIIPEPSTFVLAALALLGLAWYGRQRRRR